MATAHWQVTKNKQCCLIRPHKLIISLLSTIVTKQMNYTTQHIIQYYSTEYADVMNLKPFLIKNIPLFFSYRTAWQYW